MNTRKPSYRTRRARQRRIRALGEAIAIGAMATASLAGIGFLLFVLTYSAVICQTTGRCI